MALGGKVKVNTQQFNKHSEFSDAVWFSNLETLKTDDKGTAKKIQNRYRLLPGMILHMSQNYSPQTNIYINFHELAPPPKDTNTYRKYNMQHAPTFLPVEKNVVDCLHLL